MQTAIEKACFSVWADSWSRNLRECRRQAHEEFGASDLRALLIGHFDPEAAVPLPEVTIPLLRQMWRRTFEPSVRVFMISPFAVRWQIKVALHHEINRARALAALPLAAE